jgi:hypothetical protein
MKKLIAISVLVLSVLSAKAQVFPDLHGLTLDNQEMTVPTDTKGKYTFLALAFSKKAEASLNTWSEAIYADFLKKKGSGMFDEDPYDANLFFVPMFSGINKAAANTVRKKAVQNIDERLHGNVLFYKGSIKAYQTELKMTNKNEPYFFLLDAEGNIVYQTSGAYTAEKMAKVEDILDAI